MVFYSSLNKIMSFSDKQVNRLICEIKLPKAAILKRNSRIIWVFSTLLFKNYLYTLQLGKTAIAVKMVSFLTRMRNIRGLRHLFHLPVNGQRSKTNANTQRRKGSTKKIAIKQKKK